MNWMPYSNLQEHPLLANFSYTLVPLLEEVPDFNSFASPRLFSTHSTCKIVYVYRNPKDTFMSLWHLMKRVYSTTVSLEEAFDKFCRGMNPFGPYWDNVLSCWKESMAKPTRKMLLLKYEEMKEQPITHLKKIIEFLDCPFSLKEEKKGKMNDILKLCSFDNLSNLNVNKSGKWHIPDHNSILLCQGVDNAAFFHQDNTRDWVNYLKPKMAEKLDHIIEEKSLGIGLEF
ncbi:hypothetical protein I3842_11G016300 [Carya illinoinensis]|uniref:Sulfotransferase n=1 Tax=Carya illinoinensis TaxID=32201 RepID=A0A922DL31_CARIL|nr:hypothetical protein I3842_11G016300 [Carya illinoinensis]